MIATACCGYIFEMLGRRWTLFLSYFLTAGLFFAIPYAPPSFALLILCRCMIGVTMAAPLANPLIPDYVIKSSRARAIAMCGVGAVLGEVFSMGVLFNFTKSMTFENAFLVAGSFVLFCSFVILFLIKDPDMKNLRKDIAFKQEGGLELQRERRSTIIQNIEQLDLQIPSG